VFQKRKSRPPNPFLGVTRSNGEIDTPATRIELEYGVSSNLWLSSLANGMVPEYEEHVARLEHGIGLDVWANMNVDEKAMIIAVRRTTMAMKNLQSEAEIRQSEKKR
jgi:hypothetical protein